MIMTATLLQRMRGWLLRRLGGVDAQMQPSSPAENVELAQASVAYDESWLDRARMQWHLGDWAALSELDNAALSGHPDRAKLALLSGAALLQLDQVQQAARYVELARSWGCSNRLIAQILIAGVHNSLARASLLAGNEEAAQSHFHLSIAAGTPGMESSLVVQARARHETARLARLWRDRNAWGSGPASGLRR